MEKMKMEKRKHASYDSHNEHSSLGSLDLGIPSWDNPEPNTEGLTPLKNRFSAQHDCSEEEAYRTVRGSTTSANIKRGGY